MLSQLIEELECRAWRNLPNFTKEWVQVNCIHQLLKEAFRDHKNINIVLHFRVEGSTEDLDILILKEGRVKEHLELTHLGKKSWRSYEYTIEPRRQLLRGAERTGLLRVSSHHLTIIQNGGFPMRIPDGAGDFTYNYLPFTLNKKMARTRRRRMRVVINNIRLRVLAEPRHAQHVYYFGRDKPSNSLSNGQLLIENKHKTLQVKFWDKPPPD